MFSNRATLRRKPNTASDPKGYVLQLNIVVAPSSRYGIPVLKPLTPQLVSVQSARRCFSSAFWIPGQHHGTTLWDSPPLPKTTSPRLFRDLFFLFFLTSSFFLLAHNTPKHTRAVWPKAP
ncbi:hypothetical protein TNCV_5119591 [Trichonephila clavipes]|nr:hypothetical protein TNCV_5119591 [Trichonephila clavipes]